MARVAVLEEVQVVIDALQLKVLPYVKVLRTQLQSEVEEQVLHTALMYQELTGPLQFFQQSLLLEEVKAQVDLTLVLELMVEVEVDTLKVMVVQEILPQLLVLKDMREEMEFKVLETLVVAAVALAKWVKIRQEMLEVKVVLD